MGAGRHSRSWDPTGVGFASRTLRPATGSATDPPSARRPGCGRAAIALALCALLANLSFIGPARADSGGVAEYALKAAFLFHFTKFVTWPESALQGDELVLCLLGKDPFGKVLDKTVRGKTAQGRKITLRRMKQLSAVNGCHLLFLSHSERKILAEATERLRSSNVLIVSEARSFGEPHGMVKLVVDQRKVRIEVDVSAAQRAGLRISSNLLRLAVIRGDDSARNSKP